MTVVLVVGANQRSSSLAFRDRLYVEDRAMPEFLENLRHAGIGQALVVSTCDRVEVQAVHDDCDKAVQRVVEVLARRGQMSPEELNGQLYVRSGEDAVRHIFSVVASLDSLVIGEPYVLGQMKASHRAARQAGMTGHELEAVLQAAYGAAKRVRTETAIGARPVSMAAAAVDLARGVHGELNRCGGLLLGVGDTGQLIAETLLSAGLGQFAVAHPRLARAETLAQALNCHVAFFDDLAGTLADADIIVTALGNRRRIITGPMIKAAMRARRNRPVFLIDAAVPGDVDPVVERLDGVFLYTLSDLERVAVKGRVSRQNEAQAAWRIIEAEVANFLRGRAERDAVPALKALRQRFDEVRKGSLADAGGDAEKATRLLVNRLLHRPSQALREMAAHGPAGAADLSATERALRRVFGLGSIDEDEG